MGLKGFERKLEHAVEGTFARVFKSGLRPVELGRRLTREMDDHRSVDVRGRTVVPNAFTFAISQEDLDQFADITETLSRELCDAAREHARDENYAFLGPVTAEIIASDRQSKGTFALTSRMKEGPFGAGAGSLLLPTNERYELGGQPIAIGRSPECEITIMDSNVSRRHAEIQPRGDGYVLVDLGSTNGTRVNGVRVAERDLRDGDELAFGTTRMVFQAS